MKGRSINLDLLSLSKDEPHRMDILHPHLGTEGPSKQKGYLGNNHQGFVKSSAVRCT